MKICTNAVKFELTSTLINWTYITKCIKASETIYSCWSEKTNLPMETKCCWVFKACLCWYPPFSSVLKDNFWMSQMENMPCRQPSKRYCAVQIWLLWMSFNGIGNNRNVPKGRGHLTFEAVWLTSIVSRVFLFRINQIKLKKKIASVKRIFSHFL